MTKAVGFEESSYEIPRSRGIPPVVRWMFVIGLLVIFFMGFISFIGAVENHVWPATKTTQVPLNGKL